MAKKKRPGKGSYGDARLPVARAYPPRQPRRWLMAAGGVLCAGVALWLGGSILFGGGRAVAPGPVASGHANFEAACASCHDGFRAAAPERCLACHGRAGAGPDGYSYATHYAYRRASFASPEEPEAEEPARREVPCATCHREHRGREAALTTVPDALCTSCHPYGSFAGGHPEFDFAREGAREGGSTRKGDDPNLTFPHRLHVAEVTKRLGLAEPLDACLRCHEPDDRGEGFRPLDFDRHCDACHLTVDDGTPRLPAGDPGDPEAPGVLTLADFRGAWGPGVRWALFTNPDEFREVGGTVTKRPVYHEDPWILANLRRIRATLYGDLGLGGLLATGVDEGSVLAEGGALYEEAIAALQERAAVLRSLPDPSVQEELRRLEALLDRAEERLRTGEGIASTAPFVPAGRDPAVSAEHAARLETLALDLTTPCRRCHVVTDAAIQRVQKDQRTLIRAEFDHRAHVVQRPDCTSCHGAIPKILDGEPKDEDDPTDVAETQNLPTVAVCRECHTPAEAASSCVTCHEFHPGSSRHAGLVAFARTDSSTGADGGGEGPEERGAAR